MRFEFYVLIMCRVEVCIPVLSTFRGLMDIIAKNREPLIRASATSQGYLKVKEKSWKYEISHSDYENNEGILCKKSDH